MPTIEEIKKYLRIDFDDDDQYIELLRLTAREYIQDAIGTYDESSSRVKLLTLCIIGDLYENRQYTASKFSDRASRTIQTIVLQLQCAEYEDED